MLIAIFALGMYRMRPATAVPLPAIDPGAPLAVRAVNGESNEHLFAPGSTWSVALVSGRCGVCRTQARNIAETLALSGADRTAWLSVDDSLGAIAFLRYLPTGDTLWRFADQADLRRMRVRFVPLMIRTNANGRFLQAWNPGGRDHGPIPTVQGQQLQLLLKTAMPTAASAPPATLVGSRLAVQQPDGVLNVYDLEPYHADTLDIRSIGRAAEGLRDLHAFGTDAVVGMDKRAHLVFVDLRSGDGRQLEPAIPDQVWPRLAGTYQGNVVLALHSLHDASYQGPAYDESITILALTPRGDQTTLATITGGEYSIARVEQEGELASFSVPRAFGARAAVYAAGEYLVYGNTRDALTIVHGDSPPRTERAPAPPRVVTADDLAAFASALPDSTTSAANTAQWRAFKARAAARTWPAWQNAALTPSGALWLQDYSPSARDRQVWREAASRANGRVLRLPQNEVLKQITDSLVLTWKQEERELRVYRYVENTRT